MKSFKSTNYWDCVGTIGTYVTRFSLDVLIRIVIYVILIPDISSRTYIILSSHEYLHGVLNDLTINGCLEQ